MEREFLLEDSEEKHNCAQSLLRLNNVVGTQKRSGDNGGNLDGSRYVQGVLAQEIELSVGDQTCMVEPGWSPFSWCIKPGGC